MVEKRRINSFLFKNGSFLCERYREYWTTVLKLNDEQYMNWKYAAFQFIKIIQYQYTEMEYHSKIHI